MNSNALPMFGLEARILAIAVSLLALAMIVVCWQDTRDDDAAVNDQVAGKVLVDSTSVVYV